MAGVGNTAFGGTGSPLIRNASAGAILAQLLKRVRALEEHVDIKGRIGGVRAELAAMVEDPTVANGAPFNQSFTWNEAALDTTTAPHGTQFQLDQFGGQSQFGENGNDDATLAVPPTGRLEVFSDEAGRTQFIWHSISHVLLARITQVLPPAGPNSTYQARSVDQAYRTPTPLTPIDRWPGVPTYLARPNNSLCLLAVESATSMHLIAFESPELNSCPAGAAAGGSNFALTVGL